MIPAFNHPYANSHHLRFKRAPGGGLISDVLVIVANIPLEAGTKGYDAKKVEDLVMAAYDYAKSRNEPYNSIGFVQG
jgi:hypothetical protein